MRARKVPPEVRLAIYLASKRGVHVKALMFDYGLSRRTIRDCTNNETRIRAIAPDALTNKG